MERRPHIVAIPGHAQGHVIPLLELCQCLIDRGFKITFVNCDYYHEKILNASQERNYVGDRINFVSIPDGLKPWEDRNDFNKFTESFCTIGPGKLVELIHKINESEDDKVICIIADACVGWAFEVAVKMNIRGVAFWPTSAAMLAQLFHVDKFIQDEIIDKNGMLLKNQTILLAPKMPAMCTSKLLWLGFANDEFTKRFMFDNINNNNKAMKFVDRIVCNSAHDFEPGAFTLVPNIVPIRPLLARNRKGNPAGGFWQEDTTCLKWLDQQPLRSVIYVAFGSITIIDKKQFQEIALGLELIGRPFLWVVRPGITKETNAYPDGFEERVANQGKIVEWAPQQEVLSHPSVGCFVSHCGWNSTMEGVANGVPFLCWPYFADQFLNETYICDVWKVGLKFDCDEFGVIRREEIKDKVEKVLRDEDIKEKAKQLKEIALTNVGEFGTSKNNFNDLVEYLRQ